MNIVENLVPVIGIFDDIDLHIDDDQGTLLAHRSVSFRCWPETPALLISLPPPSGGIPHREGKSISCLGAFHRLFCSQGQALKVQGVLL